jgi:dienelactone hydrolase
MDAFERHDVSQLLAQLGVESLRLMTNNPRKLAAMRDAGIPVSTVDEMKTRLAAGNAASKGSEFMVYPDAPHAFHADYRPSFRKEAAEDGWKRAAAWFNKHLA